MLKHFLGISLWLAALSIASAEVVRVEVSERTDVTSGYEQIVGKLHFEIDPAHPQNRIIADVDLAPKNAAGKVAFSADLRILKPKDAARSNGAAWVEIPNRGGKSGVNRFISENGFTLMQVGWEFDVPAQPGKVCIKVPAARQADGKPVRGVVSATFTTDKPQKQVTLTDLSDYPPVDLNGPDSRLVMRASTPYAAGKELPRGAWKIEGQKLIVESGFEPGKTYEISYLAQNPPVAGLGLAAIRDAVSWLKYDSKSLAPVRHACAFGSSQCGRLLREFIYLGFNTDERDRLALDGIIAHIAGAGRLDFNRRWSTPRSLAEFKTASYPFTDKAVKDPITGLKDGVHENPRVTHRAKVFYINTASEYWGAGRAGGLSHTSPDGKRDIALPDNVRSYFFAGTQHGPAAFPPKPHAKDALLPNPVNSGPAVTALRMAMHHWVAEGTPPPPSVYPKIGDGTLVPASEVRFPAIPGVPSPRTIKAGPRFPNPQLPNGAGAGAELPLLVPQVDADGNDMGGIRMPDISVPLATCTGWMFRPPSTGGADELVFLRGCWVPFASTKAQREQADDPRPALAERYPSKEVYMTRVDEAMQQLVKQRFLLSDDLNAVRKVASDRWDWIVSRKKP